MSRRPGRPSIFWEALAVVILRPLLFVLVKRDWRGRLPREGGCIIALNHLSTIDPLLISHFLYVNGRWMVFMIKGSLFEVPVLGWVLRKLVQIPVARGRADAALSLKHAEKALREGACVIVYPEGTVTRDPDQWPMTAKTGVARLALATGVPVIPVAHWGAQELLPYGQEKRPRLLPRKTFRVIAGPPVDLSKYAGKPMRGTVLREATADIMAAITGQLAELRGEKAPDTPYDMDRAVAADGKDAVAAPDAAATLPGGANGDAGAGTPEPEATKARPDEGSADTLANN